MPLAAIEEIFSAGALSTWHFAIENGQGCYIPAYQRPYSWDKDTQPACSKMRPTA